jgi:hypothetical protein
MTVDEFKKEVDEVVKALSNISPPVADQPAEGHGTEAAEESPKSTKSVDSDKK